jgi:hypothetical protein
VIPARSNVIWTTGKHKSRGWISPRATPFLNRFLKHSTII